MLIHIPYRRCLPAGSRFFISSPTRIFNGVLLRTIPVPPGACSCTPDALNAWRVNNLSRLCVDLFLWRQKQESNRCSGIASEEHEKRKKEKITFRKQQKHLFVVDSVLQCYSERSLFFN